MRFRLPADHVRCVVLNELVVRNYGVITEARLEFSEGMTVVTGETGAGKTLLVEAVGLLAGNRADPAVVGPEAGEALIEGAFSGVRPPEWLGNDSEIVVSRHVSATGKSRAYVNGRPATLSQLRDLAEEVVAIHGQHSAHRLFSADQQLEVLDTFGGRDLAALREEYRSAYADWSAARDQLSRLSVDPTERAREIDLLSYQVRELETASVRPGDDLSVSEQLEILEEAERLIALGGGLSEVLDFSADRIASEIPRETMPDKTLAGLIARAESLAIESRELAAEVRSHVFEIDQDPQLIEELRARSDQIASIKAKYGPTLEDALEYLASAREKLEILEGLEDEVARLGEIERAQRARLDELADTLSRRRADAASEIEVEVSRVLRDLDLKDATFRVVVTSKGDFRPSGSDAVTFMFSANPGIEARPLSKIASGGELSRVMLALELVSQDSGRPMTLLFDEVDAGVGGEAAAAVGEHLSALSDTHQVLCVTHLPQVASRADGHFLVSKTAGSARVEYLPLPGRVREISRMLAGEVSSVHAREHARELIDDASRKRRARRSQKVATP